MAHMIPNAFPGNDNPESREDDAYALLQQAFDDSWHVIYEPKVFRKKSQGRFLEAAPDFLALSPQIGALVIEVKNWRIDSERNRNGRPDEQVTGHVYAVMSTLTERLHQRRKAAKAVKGLKKRKDRWKLCYPIEGAILLMGAQRKDLFRWVTFLGLPPEQKGMLLFEDDFTDANRCAQAIQQLRQRTHFPPATNPEIYEEAASLIQPRRNTSQITGQIGDEIAQATQDVKQRVLDPTSAHETNHEYRSALFRSTSLIIDLLENDAPNNRHLPSLRSLKETIASGQITLGFFGVSASGKSTLINALLGRDLLQVGRGQTTRIQTEITAPERERRDGWQMIRYKSNEDIDQYIQELSSQLPEFPEDIPDLADHVKRTLEQEPAHEAARSLNLIFSQRPRVADRLGSTKWFMPEESEACQQQCHAPEMAPFIAERIIEVEHPLTMDGIRLIDVPGMGMCEADNERALATMARIDAFAFCFGGLSTLTQSDKEFLTAFSQTRGRIGELNGCLVLNQTSNLHRDGDKDPIPDAIQRLKKEYAKWGLNNIPILATDAKAGLAAQRVLNDPENEVAHKRLTREADKSQPEDPQSQWQSSGVLPLRSELLKLASTAQRQRVLADQADRLTKVLTDHQYDLELQEENLGKDLDILHKEIQSHDHTSRMVTDGLNTFLEYIFPQECKNIAGQVQEEIDQLVRKAVSIVMDNYHPHKSRYRIEAINSAIDNANKTLENQFYTMRKGWWDRYIKLREKAIDSEIPERLNRMPEIAEKWKQTRDSYRLHKTPSQISIIRDCLSRITPSLFQGIIAAIKVWLGNNDRKTVEDILYRNFSEGIKETMLHNFNATVDTDRKAFCEKVSENIQSALNEVKESRDKAIAFQLNTEIDIGVIQRAILAQVTTNSQVIEHLANLRQAILRDIQEHQDPH